MSNHLAVSFRSILLTSIFLLFNPLAWAHCGGNHSGSHPHCSGGGTGGGDQDPVFTAESLNPDIPPVDSYSLDPGGVIVYREATVDLSQFWGTNSDSSICNHGVRTGTLSTRPKSSQDPDIAVVRFGFRSELDNGKEAHHVFVMEGVFDEPLNYPPSEADPETTLTLEYWELHAEQKKAQRSDCAGESGSIPDLDGLWTVTVTRQPEN